MFIIADGVALPIGQINRRRATVAGILRRAVVPGLVEINRVGIPVHCILIHSSLSI